MVYSFQDKVSDVVQVYVKSFSMLAGFRSEFAFGLLIELYLFRVLVDWRCQASDSKTQFLPWASWHWVVICRTN